MSSNAYRSCMGPMHTLWHAPDRSDLTDSAILGGLVIYIKGILQPRGRSTAHGARVDLALEPAGGFPVFVVIYFYSILLN
ncbi:hypothetical protein MSAN_01969600 [Mycena sanguinolenta]|uniref:Uncharacterized protein n=1 Tax=Mycena sanguinolenta TaxID=230812 RepID=A0A8H7CMS2_9AGAR|nr:hypothetical protein MSAN_01969600 [Mycena sanguinolenta]